MFKKINILLNRDLKIGFVVAFILKTILMINFLMVMRLVQDQDKITGSFTIYTRILQMLFVISFFDAMIYFASVLGVVIVVALVYEKNKMPSNIHIRRMLYFIGWYLILNFITVPLSTPLSLFFVFRQ